MTKNCLSLARLPRTFVCRSSACGGFLLLGFLFNNLSLSLSHFVLEFTVGGPTGHFVAKPVLLCCSHEQNEWLCLVTRLWWAQHGRWMANKIESVPPSIPLHPLPYPEHANVSIASWRALTTGQLHSQQSTPHCQSLVAREHQVHRCRR